MMNDRNETHEPDDDALPSRLREAFARLDDPAIHVPPALDAQILSRARSGYARRMRFRPAVRWISVIGTAAAIVTIAVVWHGTLVQPVRHLAKGDINGDGKVDMLDAYVMARRLASGNKPSAAWDFTGDGKVDQADVDWVATAAVSIQPTTGKQGSTQ